MLLTRRAVLRHSPWGKAWRVALGIAILGLTITVVSGLNGLNSGISSGTSASDTVAAIKSLENYTISWFVGIIAIAFGFAMTRPEVLIEESTTNRGVGEIAADPTL